MTRGRRSPALRLAAALADSSALYALLDRSDSNHRPAVAILRSVDATHTKLILTNFIRAEAHALILNRLGHAVADRFLADLASSSPHTLVRVTESDEERALELIARYHDKDFSLTDATSFAVMVRLGIRHAFTFDRNFAQYGFNPLTLELLS